MEAKDGERLALVPADGAKATPRARPPAVDPLPRLILWKSDLCAMLAVSIRTLNRMLSAGEIPAPDRRLRGRPAWVAETIREWAARGCPAIERNSI